ncbi:hypothetical protein CVV65_13585 [Kyrpidia spormannii]|uniref:Uncharacterized protein n=1 Tax=Kyrpidia spormannii TaxID=2055160 RepID=A0A2K8N922_9BACL|nr:hypothetical protein [Kyrpidia spormannii]ATY85831.1 hypothetical protein CVV65_13585 [Kyrpidia spormannii]
MSKPKKKPQTGGVTRIKAACGHLISYPAAWNILANEMNRAFITVCGCECGNGHAIIVQKSGIDIVTSDNPLRLVATLDKIPVHEEVWVDESGILPFKSTANKKLIHQFMSRLSKIGPPLTGKEKRTRELTKQFFQ